MSVITRRDFLRQTCAGAVWGAFSQMASPILLPPRPAAAAVADDKRLIFIFLRGGNDGINTIIPHADHAYNNSNRPTLYIPYSAESDLNGFVSLHPSMSKLKEVFDVDDLALLHRIGYTGQSRSHFSSQHFWENAAPGDLDLEEGWLYRLMAEDELLRDHPLPAASIADQMQLLLKGKDLVVPQFGSIPEYGLGAYPLAQKLIGKLPEEENRGLLALYGQQPDASPYSTEILYTGTTALRTLEIMAAIDPEAYVPEPGATYPSQSDPGDFPNNARAWSFFEQIKNGIQLMKAAEADLRFFGVDLGSFDTHSNQANRHADLLHILSHALRSIRLDLQADNRWDDTLVVVASEFGRTSRQNESLGTDHGEAGVMMVAGGAVIGGVYNADPSTWEIGDTGAMFEASGRYLSHLTDYRSVYAEIITHMAGSPAPNLEAIIPGWSGLIGPTFAPLGFV